MALLDSNSLPTQRRKNVDECCNDTHTPEDLFIYDLHAQHLHGHVYVHGCACTARYCEGLLKGNALLSGKGNATSFAKGTHSHRLEAPISRGFASAQYSCKNERYIRHSQVRDVKGTPTTINNTPNLQPQQLPRVYRTGQYHVSWKARRTARF